MAKKKNNDPHAFLRKIVTVLSLLGLVIMMYLTYIHFAHAKSFCDLSETVSCDVVTTSIYSEIFGIPVSILGLGYFAFVFFLITFQYGKNIFRNIVFATLFGLMPSLYLTSTEIFLIKAFCPLCETSKVIMFGILITSLVALGKQLKETLRMSVPILIAGFVAAGVTYFAQTGTLVKRDYTPLAEALNAKGVVYYASFKCNNCKRQEKLLGEAYKVLNHVECHPEGPNGNPELCLQKKIDHTPTFLIEKEGLEIERKVGLQSIEELSNLAGINKEDAEAKGIKQK